MLRERSHLLAEVPPSRRSIRREDSPFGKGSVGLRHGRAPCVNQNCKLSPECGFTPPSWCISCEWFFYLLAPLAIYCLFGRLRRIAPVLLLSFHAGLLARRMSGG